MNWLTEEHFVLDNRNRHTVLRRLYQDQRPYNRWLTVWDTRPARYFIWESDEECHCKVSVGNQDYDYVKGVWDNRLEELPQLNYGDGGFFKSGYEEKKGNIITIIPEAVESFGLTHEEWVVKLDCKDGWEHVRFPVFGEDRVKFMRLHAKLDDPMVIKFKKWEFLPWA